MKPKTKVCTKCKEEKVLNLFDRHPRGKGNRAAKCSECTSAQHKQRRIANPEIYENKKKSIGNIYSVLKSCAKVSGRAFDLTIEDFAKLRAQSCYYSGHALPTYGHGLDRIDSAKGYTLDNVRPCCTRCNAMKNNMTDEEFYEHLHSIKITRGLQWR
jgi:hypothetical protein